MVIFASTAHRAASSRIGSGGDVIAIEAKVGYVAARLRNSEGIAGIGGDLGAILRPIDKGIARVGCGCQGAGSTVVVCAGTCHRATRCRVGSGSDGIGVEGEVGHQGAVTRNVEGITGIRGSYIAAFGPVGEGITCVGRGCNGAALSRGVFSSASDGATLSRVGIDGNGIGGDSDGYLLGILSNHRIVGGDDTDLVLSIGHIGNLCSDVAAGIRGDATQFRGIAEAAVGIRHLSDNCVGSGVEVVGRHGSCQCERNGNGISWSKTSGSQVSHG